MGVPKVYTMLYRDVMWIYVWLKLKLEWSVSSSPAPNQQDA